MVLLAQALSAGGVDEIGLDEASKVELKIMQMTTGMVLMHSNVMAAVKSSVRKPGRRPKVARRKCPNQRWVRSKAEQ